MLEGELVARLQSGDPQAVDELYRAYADHLLRTAYLITGSVPAAEDAVHDAFVEVIRNARALREPQSLKIWLYRIATNKAKRSVRKKSFSTVPLDHHTPDRAIPALILPEEEAIQREERECVWQAIQGLSEIYQVPLILRYYAELSDYDISQSLNIPVGTVKSRLFNGRKMLFTMLTAHDSSQEGGSTHA